MSGFKATLDDVVEFPDGHLEDVTGIVPSSPLDLVTTMQHPKPFFVQLHDEANGITRVLRPMDEREGVCQECGRGYPVWYAPNALWNRVMRQPDGSDVQGFVCPTCFANAAVVAGVDGAFVLYGDVEAIAKAAHEQMLRLWSQGEGPTSFVECTLEALRTALAERGTQTAGLRSPSEPPTRNGYDLSKQDHDITGRKIR